MTTTNTPAWAVLRAWNVLSEDLEGLALPSETTARILQAAEAIDALMDAERAPKSERETWIPVSQRFPRKDEVLDLIEERDGDRQTGAWLGKVIGLRGDKVGPANFFFYGAEGGNVLMDGDECGYWLPYPDWRTAGRTA